MRMFINLTPHPIRIYTKEGVLTIPPVGEVFRLDMQEVSTQEVDGIPIVTARYELPERLPSCFYNPDAIVIVSLPALMALATTGILWQLPATVVAPDTSLRGAVRCLLYTSPSPRD